MSDVFVSYKAEDRARVRPLVEALQAENLSVWWDEQVGGGEAWREKIAEQLDQASCVIVVWSKRSIGPDGRFVRDEANRAQRRGTYLPVTIDNVEPPLGFGEMQALPLNGWKGRPDDRRFRAVSECVHGMLGRSAAVSSNRRNAVPVSRRTIMAGGAAVVVAAVSGAWLLLKPKVTKANTIAVLPFANLSGDPAQAYFSDGIAEEVRSALAALGDVQVVARTSSEMLRNADAQTAAKRLNVMNVITGSVRRSPSTIRVSAQLVDGTSGIERWSQTFDRPLGDVLQIQSDIATSVAQALSIRLGNQVSAKLSAGGTRNPEAQDLLLQATALDGDDSNEGMLRRIDLLRQAIERDPSYAEALARLGSMQSVWASTYANTPEEKASADAEAARAVKRAMAIAPSMPLAYSALGNTYFSQLKLKPALEAFRRSLELPGADSFVLRNYAIDLARVRRQSEAEAMIDRAIKLDPLNPAAWQIKSWILFYGRRYPESMEAAQQTLKLAPRNLRARTLMAWNLILLGKPAEATRELQSVPADDYRRLVAEGVIAARANRKQDAVRAVRELETRNRDTVHYQRAEILAQANEKDKAIAALESAWAFRDTGLHSALTDPFLDPLRGDPRFEAIVRRVFD